MSELGRYCFSSKFTSGKSKPSQLILTTRSRTAQIVMSGLPASHDGPHNVVWTCAYSYCVTQTYFEHTKQQCRGKTRNTTQKNLEKEVVADIQDLSDPTNHASAMQQSTVDYTKAAICSWWTLAAFTETLSQAQLTGHFYVPPGWTNTIQTFNLTIKKTPQINILLRQQKQVTTRENMMVHCFRGSTFVYHCTYVLLKIEYSLA